jgi:hypothetical protein
MLLAAGLFLAGISATAQTAAHKETSGKPTLNLSGYWELHFDSMNVPPAQLASAFSSEDPSVQFKHDIYEIRWCHFFGVPYVMLQSPIDILQSANGKEVVISTPLRNPSRHIYTDGRGHVNPETFDPVSGGHSIGRWDGETLGVDTIGFSEEGVTRIPGGGRRTKDSHLVERFRLVDPNQLSVVSTWDDPKVFAKPHTYEIRYFRAPKFTELREFDCNAADETRAKYLMEPPGSQLK